MSTKRTLYVLKEKLYEGTGKVPSSYDVADALNGAGFTTSHEVESTRVGAEVFHIFLVVSQVHCMRKEMMKAVKW